MICTPLRIVEFDNLLSSRLFGKRPDLSLVVNSSCQTICAIETMPETLVYLGLINDFDFVLNNLNKFLYSDNKNIIIQEISKSTSFFHEPELHSAVSLKKLDEIVDEYSEDIGDIHKIGGYSFWLHLHPQNDIQFIAQLTFPNANDLILDVDWPTGEYTIELFNDLKKNKYCVLWRMHS